MRQFDHKYFQANWEASHPHPEINKTQSSLHTYSIDKLQSNLDVFTLKSTFLVITMFTFKKFHQISFCSTLANPSWTSNVRHCLVCPLKQLLRHYTQLTDINLSSLSFLSLSQVHADKHFTHFSWSSSVWTYYKPGWQADKHILLFWFFSFPSVHCTLNIGIAKMSAQWIESSSYDNLKDYL